MVFASEGFDVSDAIASSQGIYEAQFFNWGVRTVAAGANAVNPNFQYPQPGLPGLPSALAAIAIGPRSTVDRCWATWDRQKPTTPPPVPGSNGVGSRPRPLSVQAPILFASGAQAGILPSTTGGTMNNSPLAAMQGGQLYVFPKDTTPVLLAGSYEYSWNGANRVQTNAAATTVPPAAYNDQVGTNWPWPTASTPALSYEAPFLELLLYLREPSFAPCTARFPYFSNVGPPTAAISVTGSYQPVGYYPIFGRKHVSVGVVSSAADSSIRLGLLTCISENQAPGTSPPFELPGGTQTGIAANATAGFFLNNPCADYLIVYANVPAPANIFVQVSAYD
jgi:hypothetical protein